MIIRTVIDFEVEKFFATQKEIEEYKDMLEKALGSAIVPATLGMAPVKARYEGLHAHVSDVSTNCNTCMQHASDEKY